LSWRNQIYLSPITCRGETRFTTSLKPGAKQTVSFELRAEDLYYTRRDLSQGVEPGAFKVWIGPNCRDGIEMAFELVGHNGDHGGNRRKTVS
jgi:hypothetical protein